MIKAKMIFIGALTVSLVLGHATFEDWAVEFEKTYSSDAELSYRKQVWEKTLIKIEKHNAELLEGKHTYGMGLNQFSDMTPEEFKMLYLTPKFEDPKPVSKCTNWTLPTAETHDSKDWRKGKHKAVTYVKDQGQCGSCWSFASTGTIEGAWARHNNYTRLDEFAEQQIVDCSKSYGNEGCRGGFLDAGVTYAMDKGLENEHSYHYLAEDGHCKYDESKVIAKPDGCYYIPPVQEKVLQQAVDHFGPVGISIMAGEDFQNYSWGVFNGFCSNKPKDANHGVLVVGFTKTTWIVKNSWGGSWGKDGYIEFAKGRNMCGLANEPILAYFNGEK